MNLEKGGNEMNDYILQTKNLKKSYKEEEAVRDVSLNINKNSVYGLLGPNGAYVYRQIKETV